MNKEENLRKELEEFYEYLEELERISNDIRVISTIRMIKEKFIRLGLYEQF